MGRSMRGQRTTEMRKAPGGCRSARNQRPPTAALDLRALENLYARYNRPAFIGDDPLGLVLRYPEPEDREIVALVASSLAYGRLRQIRRSVCLVLERLGPRPARFVRDGSPSRLARALRGFRHRFTNGADLAALLIGVRGALARHGSLDACFAAAGSATDGSIAARIAAFVSEVRSGAGGLPGHLLPCPTDGSACKRLNLFLRWMVRRDEVDPGGWTSLRPADLIVPLDTHMHRIARRLGLTARRAADWRTASEVTQAFARVAPDDPVRYDFALTRLGLQPGADLAAFLRACGHPEAA